MNDDDPAADAQPLQQLHHSPATARVPEAVGHGVFATGVIILTNPNEVVLDFVQGISNPRRVAARVVLAHAVAAQFAAALEGNLTRYTANFGPPRMPAPPPASPPTGVKVVMPPSEAAPARPQPRPEPQPEPEPNQPDDASSEGEPPAAPPQQAAAQSPIADIYEQIRLSDDMVGGAYANVVAISHTPAEFCFDFIASVYPRSAVTARVYLAAPRAAEALASLRRSLAPRHPPG